MTTRLNELVRCFVADPTVEQANETIKTANFRWHGQPSTLRSLDEVAEHFGTLASDTWMFSVELDCAESPFTFTPQNGSRWADMYRDLGQSYCDCQSIYVSFSVSNRIVEGIIRLFDPEVFFRWISDQRITDLIGQFSFVLDAAEHVAFVHSSFDPPWGSETFAFVSSASVAATFHKSAKERAELTMARREVVTTDWNCRLFPEDFRIITGSGLPSCYRSFARLENFLSVASLADAVIKSDEDHFLVRLIGHRMQEETFSWSTIPESRNDSLQQIYDWVYQYRAAGPLGDRLGLARNFISLHWTDSIFNLDPRVLPAIKSGYELYLTRNLKDYVEIRSKVTSFILEIDGKASKSVENAVSNLEKNFYGLVTFVTSFLLIKVLQDKTFDGAFTQQTASLGYALAAISLLHALYAKSSVNAEMDRSEALYVDLRRQYSTFFAPIDFDKIFGNIDSEDATNGGYSTAIAATRSYVEKRMRVIMSVWIISISIASGIVCYHTYKAPQKNQQGKPITATLTEMHSLRQVSEQPSPPSTAPLSIKAIRGLEQNSDPFITPFP